MDVRCERCRAQYVFDDEQVTPAGLTVQCTNCGHVFKVKKKELVVTVPVKPEEMEGKSPLPANAVPRSAPAPADGGAKPTEPERPKEKEWRVRQANGNVFTFKELTTLQKWIVEQKVTRDDEISLSGDQWKRLGNIAELASFFQVVEAAERARTQAASIPAVTPVPMAGVFGVPVQAPMFPPAYPGAYGSGAYPLPSGPPAPAAPPSEVAAPAALAPRSRRAGPSEDVALGEEELRAAGRGSGTRVRVLLATLVVLAGGAGAAWRWAPELLGLPARRPPVAAVPIVIEAPAAEARPAVAGTAGADPSLAVASTPVPTPEPVGEAALPTSPEPVAKPEAAKPEAGKAAAKPRGAKALIAQAERLRDRGDAERALDLYGRAIDEDPGNADALAGRGMCYLDLSRYPPAEASFEAALQVAPEHADALLGLAETYRWQGKKADAIKYYERYLALHPDGEEAEVARNAIQQLRE
jgi:predicted Zn finger-like uncharacterized protein